MEEPPKKKDEKKSGEAEEKDPGELARAVAKAVLVQVTLGIAVLGYCLGGVYAFIAIEGPNTSNNLAALMNISNDIEDQRLQLAHLFWAHKWDPSYNTTIESLIQDYHTNVTYVIGNYSGLYSGSGLGLADTVSLNGWHFSNVILLTIQIVSTIGYGNICPVTSMGQVVCVIYAFFGIPLMLAFLSKIGDAMAEGFRRAYEKGCCCCCNRRRGKEYTTRYPPADKAEAVDDVAKGKKKAANAVDEFDEDGNKIIRDGDAEKGLDDVPKATDAPVAGGDEAVAAENAAMEAEGASAEDPEVVDVPVSLTLVVLFAYVMVGGELFANYNNWTTIQGAYFSFITLATIGFGDLLPGWSEMGTAAGNIKFGVTGVYIILGLAVLSMSFSLMMEEMILKVKWMLTKLGVVDAEPVAAEGATAVGDKAAETAAEKTAENGVVAAAK